MKTKLIFGATVAFILLGFYIYAIYLAVRVAQCVSQVGCTTYTQGTVTNGVSLVLTLVGGLICALVVAELALTKAGEAPAARMVQSAPATASTGAKVVATLYIAVWLLAGVAAFVVGVMQHEGAVQALTDVGKSWFGLAVAAAYSYLGVQPDHG